MRVLSDLELQEVAGATMGGDCVGPTGNGSSSSSSGSSSGSSAG